jgi:hypothetical protein
MDSKIATIGVVFGAIRKVINNDTKNNRTPGINNSIYYLLLRYIFTDSVNLNLIH